MHRRDVLAGDERAGVGAGAGEDDRVVADRISSGSSQRRRRSSPTSSWAEKATHAGSELAAGFVGEVDRDLLPVGLVVVGAAEARTPVVHGVEEPVLEHDVAAVAHDAAVVGVDGRVEPLAGELLGGADHSAGNGPAQQQADPEQRVEQPGQQADVGEPAPGLEPRSVGAPPPRPRCPTPERPIDEPERQVGAAPRRRLVGETVDRQLADRHDAPCRSVGIELPQGAGGDVRFDGGREEQFALGETHDRLEGSKQGQVGVGGGIGDHR